jgi:glycosyltransferase involved in cell wall biosynthesis
MRIALVAPLVTPIVQPYLGGAQALVAELAQGLQQRHHDVTIFAREGSHVPDVASEMITVPESVVPAQFAGPPQERPTDPGFFAQANIFLDLFLRLRQRQEEFDVVHAHAFDWPSFTCSALLEHVPVVHTIHLPPVSPEINEALRILHRQGHPLTLVTVSRACARAYADYTPFDHVIYNGLDLEAIPFSPQVAEDAPLLFAGRITAEKGVEEAIEIAEQAGWPLLIAGGIYDPDYYQTRIAPRLEQAGERVRYLGQLDHAALWNLMGQARGLLFPSIWDEPFGLTMSEAMATGTPVIAFQRGAAEEIVCDGETGFLVGPGDCAAAAILVEKLPTLSRARSRAHIELHFSFEQMLSKHEEMYAGLLR